MIEENVLGNKVKNLRLKMKLTQEQFAKKMGMTRNTYLCNKGLVIKYINKTFKIQHLRE